MLTSSLLVGLVVGAGATVFGYSNLSTVNVNFSVLHINGVPLWTVAVVPLVFVLVVGTLYHWTDSLHHFTEHMRHRRRVHELEAEVASLRAHLDKMLEMPDHSTSRLPDRTASTASLPAPSEGNTDVDSADSEPVFQEATVPPQSTVDNSMAVEEPSTKSPRSAKRKRATLDLAGEPTHPDRSRSQVEAMSGDGESAATGDTVEQEA